MSRDYKPQKNRNHMDKKYTINEYESPRTSLLILNMEGLLCGSTFDWNGNDDMPSEDLGDIFA